jgi:hypothetical protein
MLCGFENILNKSLNPLTLKLGRDIAGNDSTAGFLLSGALNERDFTN